MTERAVVLVHDRDPELARRNIGTLAPELDDRGYTLDVHSFQWNEPDNPPLAGAAMVVVMGSPDAVYEQTSWIGLETAYLKDAVELEVPILGVCFGGQLLAHILGGSVEKSSSPEYGMTGVDSERPGLIGDGPWMQFHGDTFTAPHTAEVIAKNSAGQQAFVQGPHLGVQFHPEIDVDTYASWAEAWERDGVEHDGALIAAIGTDIEKCARDARARCSTLLDAWIRSH